MGFSKIVLVGANATGKTALVHQALTGKFLGPSKPTLGVAVHKLWVDGRDFRVWDTAGKPKNRGLGAGYYKWADGCIAFYLSKSDARALTDKYVEDFLRENPNAPVVYVWSGCDIERERKCADTLGFEGPKISACRSNDWKIPFRMLAAQIAE